MNAHPDITTHTAPAFATGFGQHDTHKGTGQPYGTVTGRDIVAMIQTPQSVAKDQAQWFVPSTYCADDARESYAQQRHGQFWFLSLDLDKNNLDLSEVLQPVRTVCGDVTTLAYSTSSATADARKWRVLVPLSSPIAGTDYADTMRAFFYLIQAASAGIVSPDLALACTNQLIILPNKRGEFYQHDIGKGRCLDLTAGHAIIGRRDTTRADLAAATQEAAQARARRAADRATRPVGGDVSPIDAFNAQHAVADLLARYGYLQEGQSDDWRSPFQTGGSYATRVYDGFWITLSGSDAAQEIGAATTAGHRHGDAFDLFCHFDHGGDFKAAVATYGAEIRLPDRADHRPGVDDYQRQPDEPTAPDNEPFDLSQDALALDLGAVSWDRDARFVATLGRWLLWDSTRWARDDDMASFTRCRTYLRGRASYLTTWADRQAAKLDKDGGKSAKLLSWAKAEARILRHKNTVASVESLARSNPGSKARAKDFDADRLLLGTPGGTVDLRTGLLRPAARADKITRLTSTAPMAGRPVRWLAFLSEIFNGDTDLIDFMQRAAGYGLTGETREHKLLFLYGTGRNGKSVFLNTLANIWGDYSRRAPASTFLNSQGEKHPTDLAGLNGARLVVGSELPKGQVMG